MLPHIAGGLFHQQIATSVDVSVKDVSTIHFLKMRHINAK